MDCLFCKIAKNELKSEIVYQDKNFVSFKDIHPKAPFHILIVPRKHIESVASLDEADKDLTGKLILTAKKIAKINNLEGYKLIFNVGLKGGQTVDHLHLHLLGGKLSEMP